MTHSEAKAELKKAKAALRAAKRDPRASVYRAQENVDYWLIKVFLCWQKEQEAK